MALITEQIPEQNFELVRSRIREVLNDELQNQRTLKNLQYNITVDEERNNAIDNNESVLVNVLFNNADYVQYTEKDRQGPVEYYIDVYATGFNTPTEGGYLNSAKINQEVTGMITYILSGEVYRTLNFTSGFIGGTYIKNVRMGEPQNNGDSKYSTFCRITFEVRTLESNSLRTGQTVALSTTKIKNNDTEQGLKLEKN